MKKEDAALNEEIRTAILRQRVEKLKGKLSHRELMDHLRADADDRKIKVEEKKIKFSTVKTKRLTPEQRQKKWHEILG